MTRNIAGIANERRLVRAERKALGGQALTGRFLKAIVPYLKQVAGLLVIGSLGGLVMNTVVVLPAILLGRVIDTAIAWGKGQATSDDVWRAGLAYVGAMALYQGARLVKRWGLRIANQRIMASVRADALRGVLNWPLERLDQSPIGDLMARIIGDVEVFGRGVRELTTETWDTVLFSLSLIVAMLLYDAGLTLLAIITPLRFFSFDLLDIGIFSHIRFSSFSRTSTPTPERIPFLRA